MTREQALSALAGANKARLEVAHLKRDIGLGLIDPVEVARTSDLPIKVYDLMTSIPRVGHGKAVRALGELALSEHHVVGGIRRTGRLPLTERQREELAEYIDIRVNGATTWGI